MRFLFLSWFFKTIKNHLIIYLGFCIFPSWPQSRRNILTVLSCEPQPLRWAFLSSFLCSHEWGATATQWLAFELLIVIWEGHCFWISSLFQTVLLLINRKRSSNMEHMFVIIVVSLGSFWVNTVVYWLFEREKITLSALLFAGAIPVI